VSTLTSTRISGYVPAGRVDLYVLDCGECGVIFALNTDYEGRRRADGRTFYCPNGHPRAWAESEVDRQRKRAELAEQQARAARVARDAARDQAQAAERSARALRGHLTRLRNRIANGVCPVTGCRRNFADVRAHITGQHPEWAHEHPEALV
jgi:hypothetical protein